MRTGIFEFLRNVFILSIVGKTTFNNKLYTENVTITCDITAEKGMPNLKLPTRIGAVNNTNFCGVAKIESYKKDLTDRYAKSAA